MRLVATKFLGERREEILLSFQDYTCIFQVHGTFLNFLFFTLQSAMKYYYKRVFEQNFLTVFFLLAFIVLFTFHNSERIIIDTFICFRYVYFCSEIFNSLHPRKFNFYLDALFYLK